MAKIPPYAPGCFGSAVLYNEDLVCGQCPFAMECLSGHIVARDKLRVLIGLDGIEDRRRPKLVERLEQMRAANAVPTELEAVIEQVRRHDERIPILDNLRARRNPFEGSRLLAFDLFCQIALRTNRVRPEMLTKLLVIKGKSDTLAKVYTTVVFRVLRELGVVRLEDGDAIIEGSA